MTPAAWTPEQAEQERREDLKAFRDSGRWDEAVALLAKEFAMAMPRVRMEIRKNPDAWYAPLHFYWGMTVRNHLRCNGFDEPEIGVKNLDNVYVALIEEAAKL